MLTAELRSELGLASASVVVEERSDEAGAILGALRRGFRRAGLSDLAVAIGIDSGASVLDALERAPEPTLLVVDEAQRAHGAAVEVLVGLARGLPAGHRLVIAGRRLDSRLLRLTELGAVRLDAAALEFDDSELGALLEAVRGAAAAPATVRELRRVSLGWPAAAVLAATRMARAPSGVRRVPESLGELLDELLDGLAPDEVERIQRLAHLPLLSEAVAAACAGPDALALLRDAGLPLRAGRVGWVELPDPVREELSARTPLPVKIGRAAADAYADAGELPVALALLAGAADHDGLAALLAGRRWQDLTALDLAEIRALVDSLPEQAVAHHPFALVQVARVVERSAELEWRVELLERALAHLPAGPRHREVEAELASAISGVDPDEDAERRARAVLAAAAPEERLARSRALRALARVEAWRGDPTSMLDAESHLGEAAALSGYAGQREWQAAALAALGYRVAFGRGDLERAVAHMAAALALLPEPTTERALTATFSAEVLMYVGRLDEAEAALSEALEIDRSVGDNRLQAYASWAWSKLASLRGDAAATIQRIRQTERHPGDWFEHETGIEFLAEAATLLARVGEAEPAAQYARRAQERAQAAGYPEIAWIATGTVEARFGDPVLAEQELAQYGGSPQQPLREEWHTLLLRAHAAQRRGDSAAAGALAAQAFEAVAALGHPGLPALHEPDLAAALADAASRAGSRAAAAAAGRQREFHVNLLGGFGVSADGRALEPPPGRPSTLVKLLALAGRPVSADEASEALWPGVAAATGRRRLRNVLNRLRASCGGLVVRDGDALALAAGTQVDAERFELAAAEAVAAGDEARPGLARAALAQYAGELLAADRYEPWATEDRDRLRRRQLELLDLLADDAAERGDLDEAIRRLDQAIAVEPLDEGRYARAAELLLFQGRRGSARALVERALRVRRELDLPESRQLQRLRDATGVG